MKLGAVFRVFLREFETLCLIGNRNCSNKASTIGGDIFLKKYLRQIPMAAAKLIRYESFRFFCLMATDKVIKAEKLYIVSLAKISWSIYSVFFE